MRPLRPIHWLAMGATAGGIVVALVLPTYTCRTGYRFADRTGQAGRGPTCIVSDTGYRPRGWLPMKISVAVGGVVVAIAILLWGRRRLAAIGVLIVFVALAAPWFIRDGFEQTMRNGSPVCCGQVIDREWLRSSIPLVGTTLGVSLIAVSLLRPRRSHEDPLVA